YSIAPRTSRPPQPDIPAGGAPHLSCDERRPELDGEGPSGEHEAGRRQHSVRASLRPLIARAKKDRDEPPSREAAAVPPVVEVQSGKPPGDEQDEGPGAVLPEHVRAETAAAAPPVPHHGAQDSEHGARGAERKGGSHGVRDDEARGAAQREDHDRAGLSVDLLDVREKLANPE